jgi:hypothetical protein
VDNPVISFIAEAYGRDPELPKIPCSSVLETAAEKLAALTWRAGSELAGLREVRNPTLVRHIYDLHMIRDEYDVKEAATPAHEVMLASPPHAATVSQHSRRSGLRRPPLPSRARRSLPSHS